MVDLLLAQDLLEAESLVQASLLEASSGPSISLLDRLIWVEGVWMVGRI